MSMIILHRDLMHPQPPLHQIIIHPFLKNLVKRKRRGRAQSQKRLHKDVRRLRPLIYFQLKVFHLQVVQCRYNVETIFWQWGSTRTIHQREKSLKIPSWSSSSPSSSFIGPQSTMQSIEWRRTGMEQYITRTLIVTH